MGDSTNLLKQKMRCKRESLLFFAYLFLLFFICILYSLRAGDYVDFFPVNGTFQNYNPVRRLLAGQVPYKDFQDYLGLGHLYLGSFLTWIFGSDFRASLIAFNFLSFFCMCAIFALVGYAITQNKVESLALTVLFVDLILLRPLVFENVLAGTKEIIDALNYGMGGEIQRGLLEHLYCH